MDKHKQEAHNKLADPVTPDQGGRMTASDPVTPTPEDAVRHRAYELYRQRGGTDGQDLDDWLKAESQVA